MIKAFCTLIVFIALTELCWSNASPFSFQRDKFIPEINKLNELSANVVDNSASQAFDYANQALLLANKANYKKGIIEAQINLGIVYRLLMNYDDAFESFNFALVMSKTENYVLGIEKSYLNLARIYLSLNSVREAEYYAQKLNDSTKDQFYRIESNIILCHINLLRKNVVKASELLKSLSLDSKNLNTIQQIRIILINGYYQKAHGRLDSAIYYFSLAKSISLQNNDYYNSINPLIGLSATYLQKEDYEKSIEYINQAIIYSGSLNNIEKITECYRLLASVYLQRHDYSRALETQTKYSSIKDSLINLAFLKSIGQSIAMETNIDNLRKENSFKNQITYLLLIIIVLIISMAVGIANRLLYSRKTNREMKKAYDKLKESEENLSLSNKLKQDYLNIIDDDLHRASQYVFSIIPQPQKNKHFAIDWKLIPSLKLGGDGLGYHWVDPTHFAFYFIDVTGHGVGASLHTMSVLNILNNSALPETDFKSPACVLNGLNKMFPMEKFNDLLFTVWYGVYNADDSTLVYASGGHHPALLFNSEGTVQKLITSNALIGIKIGKVNVQNEIGINSGDSLYLFSDGVFELKIDGKIWGYDAFADYMQKAYNDKNNKLDSIFDFVKKQNSDRTLDDDFSILRIDFN